MTEPTNHEVETALRAAKRRIQKYGWCKGQHQDEEGRYCVLGAINITADKCWSECYLAVESVIGHNYIGWWNDAPDRTLEDVLAAFDAAIELARGPKVKR